MTVPPLCGVPILCPASLYVFVYVYVYVCVLGRCCSNKVYYFDSAMRPDVFWVNLADLGLTQVTNTSITTTTTTYMLETIPSFPPPPTRHPQQHSSTNKFILPPAVAPLLTPLRYHYFSLHFPSVFAA